MQVIGAEMTADTPVDTARIAEIKQAIAEGRFSINPERIADGLLQSVREMLGQRR
jgi:negative regulator of flagellin synthesis FlgM